MTHGEAIRKIGSDRHWQGYCEAMATINGVDTNIYRISMITQVVTLGGMLKFAPDLIAREHCKSHY